MIKSLLLYSTVFAGCLFEGETSLITSSFAAHRGYLDIIIVMIIAFIATQLWDWIWFIIGRKKGKATLAKRPRLHDKARKIDVLLMKYPAIVLLGYRFLYGFRTAVPIALGMSSITKRKFLIFSIINTLLWDILFSSVGYFFGAFLKLNWGKIENFEIEIMAILVVLGILTGLFIRFQSMKKISREA